MYPFRSAFFFFTLLLTASPLALAQLPEPAAPAQPSAAAPAASPQDDNFNLELRREGGGLAVRMQDFFHLMDSMFDHPVMRWDPSAGILRVEQGGHAIQILARAPQIIVDGRARAAARPVLIRQGNVLLPVESVETVLKTLGVDFEYNGATSPAAAAATPSPAPALPVPETITIATPTATPFPTATPRLTPAPKEAEPAPSVKPALPDQFSPAQPPSGGAPAGSAPPPKNASRENAPMVLPVFDAASSGNGAAPQSENMALQPPPQLADKVSLSWGQLIDIAHRRPPSTVLIVCSNELEPLAQAIQDLLKDSGNLAADVLPLGQSQRDQDGFINDAAARRPDLLLDLFAAPPAAGENQISIWAVHEALWPGEARRSSEDPAARYHAHQFQSLALGSLLRAQLSQALPRGHVSFELSPQYLLRRVSAPSASVLISPHLLRDGQVNASVAKGMASALIDYRKGMAGVQF